MTGNYNSRAMVLMRGTVLLVLALGAAAAVPGQAQRGTFRASVDLVTLSATVTGPGGRYISDLDAGDFTILEDGRKQDISLFERTRTPLAVSLLIDSSGSMSREMPMARRAASEFVARLRPDDVASIVDFNRRVQVLQPFTDDRAALERAIQRLVARGTTSMFNAIYIALRDHSALPRPDGDEIRRDVIVVLSDGDDTYSLLPYEEVLDLAKRSETAIYTIGLRPEDQNRATFKEAEYVLRKLAQETGGQSFFPTNVNDLPKIYDTISQELSTMYTLAYASRNPRRDGAWRRIVVRVTRPGLTTRTRQGYYAPGARGS